MAAGREWWIRRRQLVRLRPYLSEMEPYDEKTAVKDATALVEMVRSYWMEQAKQAEEREKKAGTFVGFALLSDNSWDKEKYIRDLKEQWDITAEEKSDEERNPESLVFDVGDMMAAVSLMPAPVPNGEAKNARRTITCGRRPKKQPKSIRLTSWLPLSAKRSP